MKIIHHLKTITIILVLFQILLGCESVSMNSLLDEVKDNISADLRSSGDFDTQIKRLTLENVWENVFTGVLVYKRDGSIYIDDIVVITQGDSFEWKIFNGLRWYQTEEAVTEGEAVEAVEETVEEATEAVEEAVEATEEVAADAAM